MAVPTRIGGKHGDRLHPPAGERARRRLGQKPISAIAFSTPSRVEPFTLGLSLMTRETVGSETPAARATSRMLTASDRSLFPLAGGTGVV